MVRLGENLSMEEICKRLDELQKDKKVQEYIQLTDALKVKNEEFLRTIVPHPS